MTENNNPQVELPIYECHKKVHALKIKEIILDSHIASEQKRETDGSAIIIPEENGYGQIKVDSAYVRKHQPKAGGYFVVYEDGYQSWSPAEAFESGYTLVNENTVKAETLADKGIEASVAVANNTDSDNGCNDPNASATAFGAQG